MSDPQYIDVVPVAELHRRLRLDEPLAYPEASLHKAFSKWKMEIDDAPILRYLYRQLRPTRHLEFGTWEGTGTCYCLEECDASVWTINLPEGERIEGRPVYYSTADHVPEGAAPVEQRSGLDIYQTDAGAFIGHRYRSAGYGSRVTQIYCDSREWDISQYGAFFDTALIDGGHSEDVVLSDTRKALAVVRRGGLILWHDFCPDPSVFGEMASVIGVVEGLTREWPAIAAQIQDAFWIQPSFLLAAIR